MNTNLAKPTKKTGYHHGDLRTSIIDAVAQLIDKNRSLSFHLKEVAELVGTSQPATYKHFTGKAALLVETAIKGYEIQKQLRDNAINKAIGSPLSKLLAIGYAYVQFSKEYPGYFLLMKNLETEEILSSKRYMKEQDYTLSLVSKLITRCIDDGVFIEKSTQKAMTLLQSTAYGLAHLYITGQINRIADSHSEDPQFMEHIFAISVTSLLSEEGKQELLEIQNHLKTIK